MQTLEEKRLAIFGHQAQTAQTNAEAMRDSIDCLEEAQRDAAQPVIRDMVTCCHRLTAILAGEQGPQPTAQDIAADERIEAGIAAATTEEVIVDDTHDDEETDALDGDATPVDSGYGDDTPEG